MVAADRRARLARTILLLSILGIPILILIIALAQRNWYPTGDQAQAELRMLSLPGRPPLLGAAGRIEDELHRQGNHPGPIMFWATWPLYALFGKSSWAFEASTAVVNFVWLSVSVLLVQRRSGFNVAAWYSAVALVLLGGFGLDVLSQPWNPWVALFPFAVLFLATWSAIEGDRWMVVLAGAAGSYSVQSHFGYLPMVLPLCAVAVAAPFVHWWLARRSSTPEQDPPKLTAPLLEFGAAVATVLVLWSGPIIDLLFHRPNNISKILANLEKPENVPIGLKAGVTAVLQAAHPFGNWVWGGNGIVSGSVLPGVALLVVWAAVAILVAIRAKSMPLTRFNALLAMAMVVAVVTVSRIFGVLYSYTFRWMAVVVALVVFSIGWGIALLVPSPKPEIAKRLGMAGLCVMVLFSLMVSVKISRQEIPYEYTGKMMATIAPEVRSNIDPKKRYLVVWDDPAYLGGIGFGLILDLQRHGITAGAKPWFRAAVEPHRIMCPGEFDANLMVVTGQERINTWRERDDAEEIAYTDPRTHIDEWEQAFSRLHEIENQKAAELGRPALSRLDVESRIFGLLLTGTETQEVVDLATFLISDGVPTAVFLQDPPPPLELSRDDARNQPCFE